MKYFAVLSIAVLAVILVLSNAAPHNPSGSAWSQLHSVDAGVGDAVSGGSLVKRDLTNNAVPHVHSASCNGGGQSGSPPPPPRNSTTSG